ncbi:MAG: glycosyltransferase family 2 protein [Saprospiraceae bacterium]|nr:MAG: glycosyltransferase family 2 protein [Saprospiraceae bacterium]
MPNQQPPTDKRQFSFIVLTYNEEQHLPRLLASIAPLQAPVFVLDSGSTDGTLGIAQKYGAITAHHDFVNHPRQWDFALHHFPVATPWTIGLDADQTVTPELLALLQNFSDDAVPAHVNGIYFNRKNYFKGRWIKHGGYFPKYLLKMFRTGVGHSDLSQNMDHRFVVPGETVVWEKGYLLEENLKENEIEFWIAKHNRYSTLQAQEEIGRKNGWLKQTTEARMNGDPDQKTAWLKAIWWKAPLFLRPFAYFIWRYFFRLGFLDGKQGLIFHFLQAFWYRLVIDIKMDEIQNKKAAHPSMSSPMTHKSTIDVHTRH